MSNYRKGSHSVFSIHLHLVWITKYRKKILSGDIAQRARSLIRGICEKHQVEILKGHIAPDHIHLFVSISPSLAVSKLMQQLKGRTAHAMINEFHCCAASTGDVICGRVAISVAAVAM